MDWIDKYLTERERFKAWWQTASDEEKAAHQKEQLEIIAKLFGGLSDVLPWAADVSASAEKVLKEHYGKA